MAEVQDMALRYGGRVVRIEVYVNTDADVSAIASKITRTARGIRQDAALAMVSVHDGARGEKLWSEVQDLTKQVAADPAAETVDAFWRPKKGT